MIEWSIPHFDRLDFHPVSRQFFLLRIDIESLWLSPLLKSAARFIFIPATIAIYDPRPNYRRSDF